MDFMLFHEDEIIYLPKDEVVNYSNDAYIKLDTKISIDQPVERHGNMVVPSQVIDHFIDEATFLWVMDWCICRSASSCQDYPIELGCLFLGDAAMKIDPKLGRPVNKEEARVHIKKCHDAGLVHLVGRNKLDTVWLKVSPGNKLLTICNCCECCCLWRILPHVSKKISSKITGMPGVSVSVVSSECVGCKKCLDVCFVNAIDLNNKKAIITDECRTCGRCVTICPKDAIRLSFSGSTSVNESIERIGSLVDVT